MNAPFDKSAYMPLRAFAFEALAVAGTAVGFTVATYHSTAGGPAMAASVKVETGQIRYRADGTDPTATVGTVQNPGDEFVVWGSKDMSQIKFIRTGGVSATLSTHFSR